MVSRQIQCYDVRELTYRLRKNCQVIIVQAQSLQMCETADALRKCFQPAPIQVTIFKRAEIRHGAKPGEQLLAFQCLSMLMIHSYPGWFSNCVTREKKGASGHPKIARIGFRYNCGLCIFGDVCANYATPHSTLFMHWVRCGANSIEFAPFALP